MSDFLDFDQIEPQSTFKEKFKGVPGEKVRCALIWPREGKGPFVMRKAHFKDKFFLCKDGICCEKLGPPKQRIACLIVKYKTKKDGTIEKREGEKVPFGYEVLEWVLTDKKFGNLRTIHEEWDLKGHDMLISCEGQEQFQNLIFTPCKESLWQLKPEYKEAIYKESEAMRVNLAKSIGADLTTDEIKELLGVEIVQPTSVMSSDADIDSLLSEV